MAMKTDEKTPVSVMGAPARPGEPMPQVMATETKKPEKVNEIWIFRTKNTQMTIDPTTSKEMSVPSGNTSGRVDKPKRIRLIFTRRRQGPDFSILDESVIIDGIRQVDGNAFYHRENMSGIELARFFYKKKGFIDLLKGNAELLK